MFKVLVPILAAVALAACAGETRSEEARETVRVDYWIVATDAPGAIPAEVASALGLDGEQSQEARSQAFQWFSTSRASEDA